MTSHKVPRFQPVAGEFGAQMVTPGKIPKRIKTWIKSVYRLNLLASVKNATVEPAASDGVSENQFIAAVVAEKVERVRTARELLRARSGTAKPRDMVKYLRRVPKAPPAIEDQSWRVQ